MSVDKCIELCQEKNFKFAGLEFGNECYCGNDAPVTTAPLRECHLKCTGDETQICGGYWRMSVYSISTEITTQAETSTEYISTTIEPTQLTTLNTQLIKNTTKGLLNCFGSHFCQNINTSPCTDLLFRFVRHLRF